MSKDRDYQRQWRLKNPDKCLAAVERRKLKLKNDPEYKKKRSDSARHNQLKRLYGMTLVDRDKIIESQNNMCPLCDLKSPKKWCVDHCHSSKKFRGVICDNCNKAIGHIRDNPTVAIRIAKYLEGK